MKESIKTIKRTAMENSSGKVEISTGVNTKTTNETAMEKCIGRMEQFIEDFGSRGFNKVLVLLYSLTDLRE